VRPLGLPAQRRAQAALQETPALGERALVDLVGLLGYYALVSMTLNAFVVPTPDGSHPFAD